LGGISMSNIGKLYEVDKIKNLKEMLEFNSEKFSSKTAFMFKNKENIKKISYAEFKLHVDSLGTMLLNLGLEDKKVAIICENRYEWAVSYLAVLNGVGVVVPIDKELPQNEIIDLIEFGRVDAVIFSAKYKKIFDNDELDLEVKIGIGLENSDENNLYSFDKLIEEGKERVEKGEISYIEKKINKNETAVILFTSGTMGSSKGVMLSHYNLASNLMSMTSMVDIRSDDVFLSILPLHHTYEATCGFLCPIYRGASVAYCEGLRHIVKNLNEFGITIMLGVPLIFESMYKKLWDNIKNKNMDNKINKIIKLSNFFKRYNIDLARLIFSQIHKNLGNKLRLLISGAAGIDPNVAKGFRDFGFGFLQGYGLTECSPIVALNRDCYFKDEAAGLPLPNLEVRIDSPNEDNVGEIICKGPSIMKGYYNNELETRRVLKEGWFFTGDLGMLDRDGFLIIRGRKKNVIITKNGKNVYPEEIENQLLKSEYILECVVDSTKDNEFKICAKVYPDIERLKEEKIESNEEVESVIYKEISKINKDLPIYKKVTKIEIREVEFEKTTTKKIKRFKVN
jgi:long-chain acyl-CoA synthetase